MKNIIQNAFVTIFASALISLFSVAALAAAPVNDHWQNATVITGTSGTKVGTNAEATAQFCEPINHFENVAAAQLSVKSVWYAWTPTESASYTFAVNSTSYPVSISAYRMTFQLCENQPGLYPAAIAENLTYNYDENRAQITFRATAGATYYLKLSARPNAPESAVFTFGWQKNKFKYFSRLRSYKSWGDQLVVRKENGHLVWYGATDYNTALGFTPTYTTFGLATDMPLAGDYDGDGVTDLVAIRKVDGYLVWYIARRDGTLIAAQYFGINGDYPRVGDFDGDGIADLAIVRNDAATLKKIWHILRSSDGQHQQIVHGDALDLTWVGDYNGDGKSDPVAIKIDEDRNATWSILLSTSGSVIVKPYGEQTDVPQSADFDGDGKTDICVYRRGIGDQAGNWYYVRSSLGVNSQIAIVKWGRELDIPQAMEMTSSGKSSFMIYRAGQWWFLTPDTLGDYMFNWGLADDTPMSDLGQQLYRWG